MESQLFRFLRGFLRLRVTGSSIERFLNLCAYHHICLWCVCPSESCCELCISKRDFFHLKDIVRKSRVSVRIIRRQGLPFLIHRYRRRKMYVIGIVSGFFLMVWLSSHIWNISVEGNLTQTDDVIFEYLEQEGIRHGMRKSEVDCKALAGQIRNYFTDFSWAAAELKGTRLIISVKEGIAGTPAEYVETPEKDNGTSLAAETSGTIVSVYVRKGRPLVKAGDEVKKGDILVSGVLPIYSDSQEIAGYQYVHADADVVIKRTMTYCDEVSFRNQVRVFEEKEKRHYALRIGSALLALPHKTQESNCTLLTQTVQLRLMDNFYLPIYIQEFTAKKYEMKEIIHTKEQTAEILNTNLTYFIKNLGEKGVQIFENDVKIEWTEKSAIASGTITIGEQSVIRTKAAQTEEELQSNEYG